MPAVKTHPITSLESYIAFVEGLRRDHGGPFWYRGCGDASHELKPSLYRHKSSRNVEELIRLEKLLVERFKQRSIPFHTRTLTDNWDWLFLMQHYGVPTRLLDWSESPLMALFFAITSAKHVLGINGKPKFETGAAIWVLDPIQWNKKSVDLRSFTGAVLTGEDPHANSYKPIGDVGVMKSFPIAIYGAHNSQRIVAQRGVFVCFGRDTRPMETVYNQEEFPTDSLTKVTISSSKLPSIYDALRRHGLTDSVAFPDLDGLAREIKREYAFEV